MRWIRSGLWLVLTACTLQVFAATSVPLIIATEDYPPFNIVDAQNGTVSGISTEKVRLMMQRANMPYSITPYPWVRAYQMGLHDANTCVYSTTRTPEREKLFKWVGPLVKNNWVIFARLDDGRTPKNLEEVRPYVLGAYRGDAVAEYLRIHGYKTDLAGFDADNPRKLLADRFDFWATGELLGLEILRRQGLKEKMRILFQFEQTEMYLACNLGIDQEQIDAYNHILHEMEKDGSSAAIEKRYR